VNWPELPYEAWSETKETLRLYVQMLGKLRHALAPHEPDWGHAPLSVTARGLTTGPIPHPDRVFDVDVDLVDHAVTVRTVDGRSERIALEPRAVADFYAGLMTALERAGVPTAISETPSDMPDPIPFPEDRVHASYDPEWANRWWRLVVSVDAVLKEHRAPFEGRKSPVRFWWGSFDVAYSRWTSAEHAAGFWPGDPRHPEPAFYAYTTPRPEGIEAQPDWDAELGELVLPYESVRTSGDPRAALLAFLDRSFQAGAG
jgi:Family of unknown function (DUF5996)